MITAETDIFTGVTAPCCSGGAFDGCPCSADERVLRAYANERDMPPMTEAQRQACIADIVRCEEGATADGWTVATDADLASGVLNAWRTCARDMGMV